MAVSGTAAARGAARAVAWTILCFWYVVPPVSAMVAVGVSADGAFAEPGGVSIGTLLNQSLAYAVAEVNSGKFDDKPGGQLGSPDMRADMTRPERTACARADWRRALDSISEVDFAAAIETRSPCDAGRLYTFVGSGLGSWVTSIGSLVYAAHARGTTFALFTGDRNINQFMIERWGELFGHKMPVCSVAKLPPGTPTRVMITTQAVENLRTKQGMCAYAAVRTAVSTLLWDTMTTGPLRDGFLARLAAERSGLGAVGGSALPQIETSPPEPVGPIPTGDDHDDNAAVVSPYVGVHLRHKFVGRPTVRGRAPRAWTYVCVCISCKCVHLCACVCGCRHALDACACTCEHHRVVAVGLWLGHYPVLLLVTNIMFTLQSSYPGAALYPRPCPSVKWCTWLCHCTTHRFMGQVGVRYSAGSGRGRRCPGASHRLRAGAWRSCADGGGTARHNGAGGVASVSAPTCGLGRPSARALRLGDRRGVQRVAGAAGRGPLRGVRCFRQWVILVQIIVQS